MSARLLLLGCAALAVGTAGCIAGPAPRDHFYRLEVATPARSGPTLPGVLEVERFTSDDVLRKPAMLRVEPDSSEVTPYGYHLWAGSPTLILQRALADYLRAAGAAQTVTTPDAGTTEDWHVTGHLRRLDHATRPESTVTVEIELRLRRRHSPKAAVQRVYRAEGPAAGSSPGAAADAFGDAVEEIFERFTADLRAAVP